MDERKGEAMKEEIRLSRYDAEDLCKSLESLISASIVEEWESLINSHLQLLRDKLAGRIE